MKVKVELDSMEAVKEFTAIIRTVEEDVRLIGKDENGSEWNLSAKSLFCSLIIAAKQQRRYREHTAHDVDWNTIYCECDRDIYHLIRKFIIE